jgi:hypothetical protein
MGCRAEWDGKLIVNGKQASIWNSTPHTGLLSSPSAANLKLRLYIEIFSLKKLNGLGS